MEESAFEQIASELRCRAVDASRACGLSTMEAEDIAQDVMLKLWCMRTELDRYSSIDRLAALMAKRLSLNYLRSSKKITIDTDTVQLPGTISGPVEQLEETENTEWLEHKMATLPNTQNTILYMRQVEHRPYEEIAKLLGIEVTSVHTLLTRARRTLMEELKKRL